MTETTIVELFNARVEALRDKPALRSKRSDETWTTSSWTDYGEEVRALALALRSEGIGRGDSVAVLSNNRAEYNIIDMATMAAGAVAVPIYSTNSAEQVQYILEHCEAKVIFCDDEGQLAKVNEVRDSLADLKKVVSLFSADDADTSYDQLLEAGKSITASDSGAYDRACVDIKADDLACLIYTSGTTGSPKGVMLSHSNIMWTCNSLLQVFHPPVARFLSFLPMAHIAERMVSHYAMIHLGGETCFGGGAPTLREDLAAVRPTLFFAVPRVFEKVEVALKQRFSELTGVQKVLVDKALHVGTRVVEAQQSGQSAGLVDNVLHTVLDKIVFGKVRREIGLDKVEVLISGAAPIHSETLTFFHAMGLPIAEVYGQTEDCGPTTLNPPEAIKIGTVGKAVPGVEVKIASDEEVLVRGGNVFVGYFKNQAATDEMLEGGWMHSGDLGSLDDDGYLTITGRKKDLIITAGGKNISPSNLEAGVKKSKYISQVVVIGDKRKFLSALVTLDAETIQPWAKKRGVSDDLTVLAESPEVVHLVQTAVDVANSAVSHAEGIKKFTILPADFTQEADEITPTLKVKRSVVEGKYAQQIDAMYG